MTKVTYFCHRVRIGVIIRVRIRVRIELGLELHIPGPYIPVSATHLFGTTTWLTLQTSCDHEVRIVELTALSQANIL